ncbi:MAG: peptide-methionine (S)-S-oxide reductase MsrA, partial [Candidatus Aminicenantes bacterium]|nr:peptide-methionine (S)-S-oxide reductase MsrA [Candidatus Aminicenantes bacterium]
FREIKGIKDTEVGYTGGMTENPDYGQVCSDRTGHAEAVRVTFDPTIIPYEDLVRFFFTIHDPTQGDGQGPDVGTQYRSVIFTADEPQKETAQKVMDELQASGRFTKPIATGIVPASKFIRAEEYHQRYYEKNKKKGCVFLRPVVNHPL